MATVDSVNGNDSTASVGGLPYLTVNAAISAVTSGQTVWVLPGTYNLSAGITIPTGVSIRGVSLQTCTIQMLDVSQNTVLVTMGENTRLEDITLKLTSAGHYALTCILFGGTTTATAKLRTSVVTVDNSAASSGGTSTVLAALCNGTGSLGVATFSFNCIKGSTLNVYSNGAGTKRGILVNNTNVMSTRDTNIYVAQPTSTASTGSYVCIETNDSNNTGSIQLRSTTIGCVVPTAGQSYTASDILQTTPATITNPTYLASPGIQIGPGTDLVTKTAGTKGFSTYIYPITVYYGLKGSLKDGSIGYLWPGTQAVANNVFPDPGTPAAYYRIQQPCLLSGMYTALTTAPSGSNTVTILVRHTPISTGTITDTVFTVTFTGTDKIKTFYNSSLTLNTGDQIHVYCTLSSGPSNVAHDLTVQLDIF